MRATTHMEKRRSIQSVKKDNARMQFWTDGRSSLMTFLVQIASLLLEEKRLRGLRGSWNSWKQQGKRLEMLELNY